MLSGTGGGDLNRADARLDVPYVYVGVSCPEPNSIACDRVGVFVSTTDKPDYVVATIDGHSLRLTDPGWQRDGAASFEGFLQTPGLLHEGPLAVEATSSDRWVGDPPVSVRLELRAVYLERETVAETVLPAVRLSAGYG